MIGLKFIKQFSILGGKTDTWFIYKGIVTWEFSGKKSKFVSKVYKLQVNI